MSNMSTIGADTLGDTPAGTWRIDPAHSSVSFSVRHLMSKVRGRFRDVDGRIDISPTLTDCSVSASIAMASVDTGTPQRDDDLRSDRFFDVEEQPEMTFASTAVEVGLGRGEQGRRRRHSGGGARRRGAPRGGRPVMSNVVLYMSLSVDGRIR